MELTEVQATISRLRKYQEYTTDIDMLADQYIENMRENHSASTMPPKITRIKQFVRFCGDASVDSVQDIDAVVVKVFLDEYAKTHKSSSTNALRKDVTVFLEWIRGFKEIDVRAHSSVIERYKEGKHLPRSLDYETVRYVIKHISNEQDRLMVAIAVEAGLRLCELKSLKVRDIQGCRIHIRGKGERDRIVLITQPLADCLHEFIYENCRRAAIFKNQRNGYGDEMSKGTMRNRIQMWFRRLAGVDMTPHQLRHTFAIMMLTRGCDIVTIKNLMGHKYIETTMIYLQVVDKFIIEQYNKYALTSILA